MPTKEELEQQEAKRKADEEEAKRKAAELEEENSDDEEEELTPEQLKAKLETSKKRIKELNHESAERRKKIEAFEKEKAEREQAELTEVQKAQAAAKKLEDEKAALAKENQALKLQQAFESRVRSAKLEFKSELAAKDAFNALVEILGEETEITEDHFKQLTRERDYYFGKPETHHENDASKKGRSNQAVLTEEAIARKRKRL